MCQFLHKNVFKFPDRIFLHTGGPCQDINFESSHYFMSSFGVAFGMSQEVEA